MRNMIGIKSRQRISSTAINTKQDLGSLYLSLGTTCRDVSTLVELSQFGAKFSDSTIGVKQTTGKNTTSFVFYQNF